MPRVQKPSESRSDAPRRKAALYVRVSTAFQIDKDSLPMQRQDLESYSRLILGIDDYEFFEDAGYSGKNTERPAYQEMMARIRKGEFSHLLVWKIDRISRNLLDFAAMYAELKRLNVTFVSRNEQFDTSSAMGEAMLKIILVFAELERNMTSERVTATMISRASNGIWNGGAVTYGYDYDPDSETFVINESERKVLRLMYDEYFRQESLVDTANRLNELGYRRRSGAEWTLEAINAIFKNDFYNGSYLYNRLGKSGTRKNPESEWVVVKDHHPAIFSEEELRLVRERMRSRARNSYGYVTSRHDYVFSGLLFCSLCGSSMGSRYTHTRKDGARPAGHFCHAAKNHNCDSGFSSDESIGDFVSNFILNMLNAQKEMNEIPSAEDLEAHLLFGKVFASVDHIAPDSLDETFRLLLEYGPEDKNLFTAPVPEKKKPPSNERLESLKKEKEKQERALRRLQDLYLFSADSMSEVDFISRKSEIAASIERVDSELKRLTGSRSAPTLSDEDFVRQASYLVISKRFQDRRYISYAQLLQDVSVPVLREYMHMLIDSIYAYNGRVTRIIFRNGLSVEFQYLEPAKRKRSPKQK